MDREATGTWDQTESSGSVANTAARINQDDAAVDDFVFCNHEGLEGMEIDGQQKRNRKKR